MTLGYLDRGEAISMFSNILPISSIGKAKVEETIPIIRAYLNPYCPWTPGVRSVLDGAGLDYEILDITQDHQAYEEMVAKSCQNSSPCVEINGHMLADVGGEEIADWLRKNGLA